VGTRFQRPYGVDTPLPISPRRICDPNTTTEAASPPVSGVEGRGAASPLLVTSLYMVLARSYDYLTFDNKHGDRLTFFIHEVVATTNLSSSSSWALDLLRKGPRRGKRSPWLPLPSMPRRGPAAPVCDRRVSPLIHGTPGQEQRRCRGGESLYFAILNRSGFLGPLKRL